VLIPPRDDIHRVKTTSAETSVSLHLLSNDTGCVWRHSYDPESGEAQPFRSGYVNVDCEPEPHGAEFVPPDFEVPHGLETSGFLLEPLGPEHNEMDYDAWTSSTAHIAATPGFPDGSWPREMTRDENWADLQRHADDFHARKGFTYTVLDPDNRDVIG